MLTDTPLSVADVLEHAADLIEPKGKWTRGAAARDANYNPTSFDSKDASCWCAMGAISRVAMGVRPMRDIAGQARDQFRRVLETPWITDFNDAEDRTQPEVVAALRRAATLARAGDA
jgi:hypothetical protein